MEEKRTLLKKREKELYSSIQLCISLQQEEEKTFCYEENYFSFLSVEMILHIFSFLEVSEMGRIARVAKEWAKLTKDETLWKVLYLKTFPERFCYGKPSGTTYLWCCKANWVRLKEGSGLGYNEQKGRGIYCGEMEGGKKQGKGILFNSCPLLMGTSTVRSDPFIFDFERELSLIDQFKTTNEKRRALCTGGDVYVGEFDNDLQEGFGIFYYSNGNKYIGDFVKGKRHGKGQFYWKNGESYIGHWELDKREKKGKYTWPDGSFYEGEFSGNIMEGFGKHYFKTGYYEGFWKENKKEGKGKIVWNNGNYFEGFFNKNKKCGAGKYVWADKGEFEGNWENDERSGKGVMIWSNGMKYEGNYQQDLRHGDGVLFWPDLCRFIGKFKDGSRIGRGEFYKTNNIEKGEVQFWNESPFAHYSHPPPQFPPSFS